MATFFIQAGDIAVIGREYQSLDKADPVPQHYTVMFHDGPSDDRQSLSTITESQQMRILSDWLTCADDTQAYERLTRFGLRAPYLP